MDLVSYTEGSVRLLNTEPADPSALVAILPGREWLHPQVTDKDVTAPRGPTSLGVCSANPCTNVYVDTSPNRSPRYCSEPCSSRADVAAFRARQRDA